MYEISRLFQTRLNRKHPIHFVANTLHYPVDGTTTESLVRLIQWFHRDGDGARHLGVCRVKLWPSVVTICLWDFFASSFAVIKAVHEMAFWWWYHLCLLKVLLFYANLA